MSRSIVGLVLLLVVVAPARAAEKWWDFYKRGLAATQKEDWSTVSSQMQKAISLANHEELAAKARNEVFVYVPHFWLGVARLKLGDVDGALAELQISQAQGIVQKTQYYSDLRVWLSRAQSQKTKQTSDASAGSRNEAKSALDRALEGQMDAMSAGADRSENFRAARAKLQEAWSVFDKAGKDSGLYQKAAEVAGQSRHMFLAAAQDSARRKTSSSPPKALVRRNPPPPPEVAAQLAPVIVAPPVQKPDTGPGIALPTESTAVSLPPPAPKTGVDTKLAERALENFRKIVAGSSEASRDSQVSRALQGAAADGDRWATAIPNATDQRAVDQIQRSVEKRSRELAALLARSAREQAAPPVYDPTTARNELRKAYLSFASGSLDQSEQLLDSILERDVRSVDALMLRGSARYTRGMITRQEKLLKAAEADFRKALQLTANLTMDSRFFSPKLISFFNEVKKNRLTTTHR